MTDIPKLLSDCREMFRWLWGGGTSHHVPPDRRSLEERLDEALASYAAEYERLRRIEEAARALLAADLHDCFTARMSDAGMTAIVALRAALKGEAE